MQKTAVKIAVTLIIPVLFIFLLANQFALHAKPAELTGKMICVGGMAGIYPCKNVNLLAHMPLSEMGAGDGVTGNDHWGWTDVENGRDYVIFGMVDGVSFVDITDRENPVYLGKLPTHANNSIWRDIKVYDNHAFIVADAGSDNGLQIFDLTQLRTVVSPPVVFSPTVRYDGFVSGHNLWINEETGYLYVARTTGPTCDGIRMFNIMTPTMPIPEGPSEEGVPGCFIDDPANAIASDLVCEIYNGPDADYAGHEICFIGSDATVSIADVTDKNAHVIITHTLKYTENIVARLHQGALTEDQRFLLFSDVSDEDQYIHNTRTYVWDMADLDAPIYLGNYESQNTARDHNVYIVGDTAYQANFNSGLRILDISTLPETTFHEIGYFDINPVSDSPAADGAWSNYPWWGEGVVTVSSTGDGLFILEHTMPPDVYLPFVQK